MASKRTTLQAKLAAAALKVLQKLDGVQLTLSHQGATAVTLWARVSDVVNEPAADSGVMREVETRDFDIPRQTSFAGAVSEGDEIVWASTTYVVASWTAVQLPEVRAPGEYDYCYRVRASAVKERRAHP